MELKINVDESLFKDVLEKELEALPKEKIQEIIFAGIENYFNNSDVIKNLFVTQERPYSYASNTETVPSKLLKDTCTKFDLSPAFKELEEKMINELKSNYQQILTRAMTDFFLNGVRSYSGFNDGVREVLYQMQSQQNNNQ